MDAGDPEGSACRTSISSIPARHAHPTTARYRSPIDAEDTALRIRPDDLYDVEILDDPVLRHGATAVSVVRYLILGTGSVDMIAVHGLTIRGNLIHRNLRREVASSDDPLRMFVGYGGICLALCSSLVIEDNEIIDNGIDWRSPVCGVFVLRVDGLRIEHNRIENNGRRGSGPVSGTQTGIRAGIHIWLAHAGVVTPVDPDSVFVRGSGTGAEQIRIHANHVIQPLGRALFLIGEGPMLITDNRFASQGAGRPATDLFADTVMVLNFGLSREWTIGLLVVLILYVFLQLVDLGDDQYENLLCLLARVAIFTQPLSLSTQPGKVAFNDNQVSFHMPDREDALSVAVSSVLLLSLDDISANDNQFEHHHARRLVLADLFALGFSVRTNDNRLAETWGRALLSLLSLGFMNTAADNQSTHCIRALGFRTAVHHNLVLGEAFCEGACGNRGGLLAGIAAGAATAFISG